MLTLAQASLLTNDVYVQGVAQAIVVECPVLNWLPFVDLNGSALVWNEESTLGSPTTYWYAVGDTMNEATFTPAQKQVQLKMLMGDADIDHFLATTYRVPNDLTSETLTEKAKAVGYQFNGAIVYGDSAVVVNQFDGLKKILGVGGQRLVAGSTGAALTLDMLDQLIDLVKPGKPDVIVMARRERQKMKKLWRASQASFEQLDMFGMRVLAYDGIPILIDDNFPITEGNETGITMTGGSSIYAVQFGMKRGLVGVTNGGLSVEKIGGLETKNANRYRIRWYSAVALTRGIGAARLAGINGL